MLPKSKHVLWNFPAWERFHQDVGTHLICGAVQKQHFSTLNSVADEVVLYVNMLDTHVVVVDVSEANHSLVITEQSSGCCKVKI